MEKKKEKILWDFSRTNGKIKITATTVNPLENPAQRTKKIQECVQEGIKQSLTNQKLFNKNYSDYLRRTMEDKSLIRAEIASDLCSELSDWWAFTSPDLYFYNFFKSYKKKAAAYIITFKDTI